MDSTVPSTLVSLLERRASDDGDRPFLDVLGERRSAAELSDRSRAVASALSAAGVGQGDRVAVIADNCVEFVELWFACMHLRAILVPINTALRGAQLGHVLADSQPIGLVVDAGNVEALSALGPTPGSLSRIWAIGPIPHRESMDGVPLTTFALSTSRLQGPDAQVDDTAALLYTSGTTGPSKGVMCPHSQLYWWGANTARALNLVPTDVLYTCLPLFHINALNTIVQGLVTGARVVIGPRFSASRYWQQLIDANATVTYLLGAMISILAGREPDELDRRHRVRVILAPATPPQLWREFEERFEVRLVEGHGMTETNYAIGPLDGEQRPGWMGRLMPGYRARVVDERGDDVPTGLPGELLLKPDDPGSFASGYWRVGSIFGEQGWFRTGDRVVCDEDGYHRFLDRVKDVIRRRGENISAWEVEQVLVSHENISTAAVVPTPSPLGEDEVRAFVVPIDPGVFDPAELIRFCGPRLAYFAIPRFIDTVEKLPSTENGKVKKYLLRDQPLGEATWDREAAGVKLDR